MSKILLDGESIFEASNAIDRLKEAYPYSISTYDALISVVYGIVLWDEVYVIEESFNSHYLKNVEYFNKYEDQFRILHGEKVAPFLRDFPDERFRERSANGEHFFTPKDFDKDMSKEYKQFALPNSIVLMDTFFQAQRAMEYLLVANWNELDYMPSARRVFLLDYYDYSSYFDRRDMLNGVDRELAKFYDEFNQLVGKESIKYRFPVLLDYLFDKCDNLDDTIKYAFELKNNHNIVRFRREMDALEKAYSDGNLKEIKEYLEAIRLIVYDISKINKMEKTIEITLSFPPSITLPMRVKKKEGRSKQLLFIKDLAYFGINKRKPLAYR